MKITSIVLLFALKASTISADGGVSVVKFADAFDDADSPDCADFNIVTFGNCVDYCRDEYKSGMSATCPTTSCGNENRQLHLRQRSETIVGVQGPSAPTRVDKRDLQQGQHHHVG